MPHSTEIIFRDRSAILIWLTICALLVALMVLVGGYTRLSGSGLSITEWKPIHGVIPPLNEAEWEEEFAAYRQSPQYLKVNMGMTLEEFKTIFWPEYWHRVLGRIVGIVFFIPLLLFAVRRSISKHFFWRLVAIFALGGLQGLVGWLMVASGLVDDPKVSFVRLAIHLSLAFVIFGLILWQLLQIAIPAKTAIHIPEAVVMGPRLRGGDGKKWYTLWFTLLFCQIILGALLAGQHGGLIYNTWPDMDGYLVPEGLWGDRIALTQFLHRKLAILLAFGFLFWWYFHRDYVKDRHLGKVCAGAAAILAAQFALGVLTLLHQVPLALALAHQMTALLLFTAGLILLHGIRHR